MGCVLTTRAAAAAARDSGEGAAAAPSPPREEERPTRRPGKETALALNSTTSFTLEKQKGKLFYSDDFPTRNRLDPFPTTPEGWPAWLVAAIGDAINDFTPRRANTFEKLDKIGQGTYSNVYKARDLVTGKIVALKKVRFDNLEPEGVKFMAREILVLRRLNHPNIIKLEGLVISRMSSSLYLVFEYMEHDLAGLAGLAGVTASQVGTKFTLPQVKCYMKQLFSGLEHCHNNGVLHRDIKGSNLLIDNEGILKIADFGLANFYGPEHQQPMTSRVVTLWYRPPELLLGATYYGIGVDLWSAGCILAELLLGQPILPGRTEVEQLHKIFKLCGSPSENYWRKYKLPNATLYKPPQPYKRCITELFKDFPSSSLPLIDALLSIDPQGRGTATIALKSEFFTTEPYACEPSSLPKYPPCKELDVKLREGAARRQRGQRGRASGSVGPRRARVHDRPSKAIPAPEANAELQPNLDRWRFMKQTNGNIKSEKFPPPHRDGAVGILTDAANDRPVSFDPSDASFSMSHVNKKSKSLRSIAAAEEGTSRSKKTRRGRHQMASARKFFHSFKPTSIGLSLQMVYKGKGSTSETSRSMM
ncbi:hypothetical protein Droror1_Dr00012571 [Drosera rotundifolia]